MSLWNSGFTNMRCDYWSGKFKERKKNGWFDRFIGSYWLLCFQSSNWAKRFRLETEHWVIQLYISLWKKDTFWLIGCSTICCGITELVMMLEKKSLLTVTVFCHFLQCCSTCLYNARILESSRAICQNRAIFQEVLSGFLKHRGSFIILVSLKLDQTFLTDESSTPALKSSKKRSQNRLDIDRCFDSILQDDLMLVFFTIAWAT